MREIFLRGKRIATNNWVEGSLLNYGDGDYDICSESGVPGELDKYAVYPKTIGQFTGLVDRNGNRIYEGDIVRCGTGRICKVAFFISPGVSGFYLVPIGGFDAQPPRNWLLFADTEIIGNIHDNPELLEDSE